MNHVDKVKMILTVVIRLILLVAIFSTAWAGQWMNMGLSLLTLFLTFLPAIVGRNFKLYLPMELEILMIIFVYSSIFLGGVHGYYTKFWWWDLILHGSAGLLLGFIGFSVVYVLNGEKRVHLSLRPVFVAIFSFAFAITLGVFWEIFEFAGDLFFGLNLQGPVPTDTMWDLTVDMLGAFIASTIGYFYIRGGNFEFLRKFLSYGTKA